MNKKGQAAMEFLMTYGWAILVVLIAIGALAYFGVLNPGKYLPSSCTISNQFGCQEFKATTAADTSGNLTTLILQNGRGVDVNITNITISNVNPASLSPCFVKSASGLGTWGKAQPAAAGVLPSYILLDGTNVPVVAYCNGVNMTSGAKFKATVTITYFDTGSSLGERQATGSIVTKAE